jgi:hypothetical protein
LTWKEFPTDPHLREATEIESSDEGKVNKLTFSGHYGKGSASFQINNLKNDKPLPVGSACTLVSWIVEHNRERLQALFDGIKKHVHLRFQAKNIPSAQGHCPDKLRNTKDFLHMDPFKLVFTAPQIHLSTGTGVMPKHFDGGRGTIVLAISLWSRRSLRLYLQDGKEVTIPMKSGHVYLANLIGVEHQVLHTDAGRAEDFATSAQLGGEYEALIFVRSATFRHMKCANACRMWNDDPDGDLCGAIGAAYKEWHCSPAGALEMPSLQDLLDAEAKKALEDVRPDKTARKSAADLKVSPPAKKRTKK